MVNISGKLFLMSVSLDDSSAVKLTLSVMIRVMSLSVRFSVLKALPK